MEHKPEIINRWQGKYSVLRSSVGQIILWAPLAEIVRGRQFGLSVNGELLIETKENEVEIIKLSKLVGLLPTLKKTKPDFLNAVSDGLKEFDVDAKPEDVFPVQELVCFALRDGGPYWARLALNWVGDMELNDQLASALNSLLSSDWVTQEMKHKASKILRRASLAK